MLRLRSSNDIERVRREGHSYAHPLVVLVVQAHPQPGPSRVAVIAGRKVGCAVQRNRAKRLLREAARRLPVYAGWDMMLIARKPLTHADFQDCYHAVEAVYRKAHVLITPPPSP